MSGRTFLAIFLGGLIGAVLSQQPGLGLIIVGIMIGFLLNAHLRLLDTVRVLREQLSQPHAKKQSIPPAAATAESTPTTAKPPEPVIETSASVVPENSVVKQQAVETPASAARQQWVEDEWTRSPAWSETRLGRYIKAFFSDGNVLVRIGVLILFVGVGFLLKLAAEHSLFPIELRLASVFVAAVAMLVLGWRLRLGRRNYALLIQGGAIGIMYLTIFAAAKLYTLFPLPLALGVMILLVIASSLLAVLQDAKALALFAAAGGFLAPVLTSSGDGSHVMLFSYYVLLNSGILFIAWHKSWRELNLEGYLFTFGIGSLWGAQAYVPQFFASTEPFLLVFFLMFVAITVLFALRQAPRLSHYVDGTLVFGVPIAGFALQALMLRDNQFGMAISALVLAMFYVGLAMVLWRRHTGTLRLLVESFLAIAVAFITLAIPLAVDRQVTAAAWALEGAGLVWVGARQHRALALISGSALQFIAGAMFINEATMFEIPRWPFINAFYLGSLLIAVSSLFSAQYIRRRGDVSAVADVRLDIVLIVWGLLWWYGAAIHELAQFNGLFGMDTNRSVLLFVGLSMLLSHLLARRLVWDHLAFTLRACIPALAFLSLLLVLMTGNVFAHFGYIAFPIVIAIAYLILKREETDWPTAHVAIQHMIISWWLMLLLCFQLDWWITRSMHLPNTWATLIWGLLPSFTALAVLRAVKGIPWPFIKHRETYTRKIISPFIIFSWIWVVYSVLNPGNPHPLPYITLLNPLEMASLLVMVVGLRWIMTLQREGLGKAMWLNREQLLIVLSAVAFLWLNSIIARGIHFYRGVSYTLEDMFDSMVFQMSISILWTLLALVFTYIAHRLIKRRLWMTGVALLAIVVLKLFFVELANTGTVERIVSFITVGILMLVIGYVAPIPPSAEVQEK